MTTLQIDAIKGRGDAVPIYKGDPMKTDSCKGITFTSMVTKVLEFLIVKQLESIFLETGLVHQPVCF